MAQPERKRITRREFITGISIAAIALVGLTYLKLQKHTSSKEHTCQNTRLDTLHNSLFTPEYANENNTQPHRLLVTGYPEEAGMIVSSNPKQTLDDYFLVSNEQRAQVALGANPFKLKERAQNNLQYALEISSQPVDLIVYSAGALSLMNLPEQYWEKIKSITFVSPMIGSDVIQDGVFKYLATVLGIPDSQTYLQNISPVLRHLQNLKKPLSLFVGAEDEILNSTQIVQSFQGPSPTYTDPKRHHAISAQEINALLDSVKYTSP